MLPLFVRYVPTRLFNFSYLVSFLSYFSFSSSKFFYFINLCIFIFFLFNFLRVYLLKTVDHTVTFWMSRWTAELHTRIWIENGRLDNRAEWRYSNLSLYDRNTLSRPVLAPQPRTQLHRPPFTSVPVNRESLLLSHCAWLVRLEALDWRVVRDYISFYLHICTYICISTFFIIPERSNRYLRSAQK